MDTRKEVFIASVSALLTLSVISLTMDFFKSSFAYAAENLDPSCIAQAAKAGPCVTKPYGPKYTKACDQDTKKNGPLIYEGYLGALCKENDKTKFNVPGRCVPGKKCKCEGQCLADGDKDGKPGEKGDKKDKEMMPMMMGMIPMFPMIPMGMPKMDMPMMPMQMPPTTPTDGSGCNRTFSWLLGNEGCNPNPGGTGSTTASTTDDTEDGLTGIATKARRILNIVINRGARTENTEGSEKGTSFTPRYTVVSVTPKDVVSMPADVKKQLPYRTDSDTKGYGSFSGASDDMSGGLFSWAQNAGTAAGDALENMRQLLLRMLQSLTF